MDAEELFTGIISENLDERHAAVEKIAAAYQTEPDAVFAAALSALRSGDLNSRWYIGRALIKMGEGVIPRLISAAESETDMNVQKYFGAVLAAFGARAVAALISLFASENAAARGMAGAALEKIGEPALDALLSAAHAENPTVRTCAGIVLMKLGVYEY
ncbi:MAG: hypothetical protein Q4Q04_06875 [Methanocorpusculum sp.]|nr:hypothetical protein [Methanocorpusculum sp.]